MWVCKATQYGTVALLAGRLTVGCTPRTTKGDGNEAFKRKILQFQHIRRFITLM
jgi:hypothetical protein